MKFLQISGAIFTIIVGTLLHFTYHLSGDNPIAAVFSAANESTWEHLKLLAMPILFFGIIEYFAYGSQTPNFIPVKTLSILFGMATIVTAFYTYVGIAGKNYLWADIGTFIVGVIAAYLFSAYFLDTNYFSSPTAIILAWVGIIIIFACFVIFTFSPPHIGLFLDPVSNTYGVARK
ncbi:MAG: DUF6512 family protein [Hydrogenoanaerobacterium sp.]